MTATYNTIGLTYDNTRRADPQIVADLLAMLNLPAGGRLLDIGCGSGNYTIAMSKQGASCTGVDISDIMLEKARAKSSTVQWILGDACKLTFRDNYFDGAICILATHHILDITRAFKEAHRVLKPGAKLVLFTTTEQQMNSYWLWEYFPGIMKRGISEKAILSDQSYALEQAGFSSVKTKPFFVTNQLCDWFLHAGKYRPEIYLDPNVRAGISSFARSGFEDEIASGVKKLEEDISTGRINHIIKSYDSNLGDYLFIEGTATRC